MKVVLGVLVFEEAARDAAVETLAVVGGVYRSESSACRKARRLTEVRDSVASGLGARPAVLHCPESRFFTERWYVVWGKFTAAAEAVLKEAGGVG